MNCRGKQTWWMPMLVVGVMLAFSMAESFGCPNCREMLSENAEAAGEAPALGRGFYWSILVMMAMPFMLAGGFGGVVWWNIRNQSRQSPPTKP